MAASACFAHSPTSTPLRLLRRHLPFTVAALVACCCPVAFSQTETSAAASRSAHSTPSTKAIASAPSTAPGEADKSSTNVEIERLRAEVELLKAQVDQLRSLVQASSTTKSNDTKSAREEQTVASTVPEPALPQEKPPQPPQGTPTVDQLIKPKLAGGQFSGSEGLLKTDRVKIGGYVDFRYATRGLDEGFEIREHAEELNPGQSDVTNFKRNSFLVPRAVLGIAAAITPKLLFNSEIEFEFGGKEVDVEQAYLEYRFHPAFNLRGGVIVMPLGRFNLFHDSNLQDIVPRPLVSTLVIPSTYKDSGLGALGEFKLGNRSRLTYEAYVVNGLRSDEGGEIERAVGLAETKENTTFFDNNSQKSVVGRLMFSPILGVELGASGYRGKHDNQGLYDLSIWALDWKFARRDFQVLGEYARSAIQRPAEDAAEIAARQFLLSLPKGDFAGTFDFLDENLSEPLFEKPSRSMDGWYVEARYRFRPKWWTSRLEEDASIAPVMRFDRVDLDRQISGFPLNMQRTSFGVSLRPTEAASFNFTYHLDQRPDRFLRLTDGRPFPPFFTNLGVNGFSFGAVWAF